MKAGAVPDVDDLISRVEGIRCGLDLLNTEAEVEEFLLEEYRLYASALYRLIVEIRGLADSEG